MWIYVGRSDDVWFRSAIETLTLYTVTLSPNLHFLCDGGILLSDQIYDSLKINLTIFR